LALLFIDYKLTRLGWQRHGTPWHDLSFLHLDWVFATQEPYWGAHIRSLVALGIGVAVLIVAAVLFFRNLRRP
jgi:hypothetical protein